MEFRWVAAIALWTMLSGPIFVQVRPTCSPQSAPAKPDWSAASKPGHLDAFVRPR